MQNNLNKTIEYVYKNSTIILLNQDTKDTLFIYQLNNNNLVSQVIDKNAIPNSYAALYPKSYNYDKNGFLADIFQAVSYHNFYTNYINDGHNTAEIGDSTLYQGKLSPNSYTKQEFYLNTIDKTGGISTGVNFLGQSNENLLKSSTYFSQYSNGIFGYKNFSQYSYQFDSEG